MAVPKKPAKIIVDTVGGDKLELERSGLQPKFVHKKVRMETIFPDVFRMIATYFAIRARDEVTVNLCLGLRPCADVIEYGPL